MIETIATVVDSRSGTAWVEAARKSACGSCGAGTTCGTAALSKVFRTGSSHLAVADNLGLRIGEQVVIGIPDGLLARASLVGYLVPLAALVAAAGLAEWIQLHDGLVALLAIVGLGAGLWLTGYLTGGVAPRDRYRPVLLRRAGGGVPIPFQPGPGTGD